MLTDVNLQSSLLYLAKTQMDFILDNTEKSRLCFMFSDTVPFSYITIEYTPDPSFV